MLQLVDFINAFPVLYRSAWPALPGAVLEEGVARAGNSRQATRSNQDTGTFSQM
jgi:hypothetical protein